MKEVADEFNIFYTSVGVKVAEESEKIAIANNLTLVQPNEFIMDCDQRIGHGFIGYPEGRNVERALGPSCPCVLCIPIHIITINIKSFLGCHISHSLGLCLLHQI